VNHTITLTVPEAASLVGVSRTTAYELVRGGHLPSVRLGRRIIVPLGPLLEQLGMTVDDWLALNRSGASKGQGLPGEDNVTSGRSAA
jgi:excisionase family DNA binding protein